MPSRNTVKEFAPDQMWHVYNRGVEKKTIFLDNQDYQVFLSYFKIALGPEIPYEAKQLDMTQVINLRRSHLYSRVELVAYCLMPNHFHLLCYQYDATGISDLMRSVATGYAMYFNKKYEHEGRIFQGTYKAAHIDSDSYWLHISRYIHLNPLDVSQSYKDYPCSSYGYYVGEKRMKWLHPEWIMKDFDKQEYENFVADFVDYEKDLEGLKTIVAG